MKETIDKLNKRSWGAMKQLGIMGGYAALGVIGLVIARWFYRGHTGFEGHLDWPEYAFLTYLGIPIVLGILGTFAKVPVWLWVEKIKARFKKK